MSEVKEVDVRETLEQKRDRLRQVVNTPTARDHATRDLMEVEQEIAARDAAALRAEAEKRLVGIKRAMGSLMDQSENDNSRVLTAARAFVEAVGALNEHFVNLRLFRHEAVTLSEVFGLPMPPLPGITPPAQRKPVIEAYGILQTQAPVESARVEESLRWEPDADGKSIPKGRSYQELDGTPARDLIRRKTGK